MENRKNDLKSLEPELAALNDRTEVITNTEESGDTEHCPKQVPCDPR